MACVPNETRDGWDGWVVWSNVVPRRDYHDALHAIAGVARTTVALGLAAGIVAGHKARLLEVQALHQLREAQDKRPKGDPR